MGGYSSTGLFLGLLAASCGGRTVQPGHEVCPPCKGPDADRDGHLAPPCGRDCDDADASRHPGAPDAAGDGVDTDCDGADGVDVDRDGFQATAHGGDDCDDSSATVHPRANDNQGWVVEDTAFAGFNMLALAVSNDGTAFLAGTDQDTCTSPYEVGCPTEGGRVLHYGTNLGGAWTDIEVDEGRIYPTIGIEWVPGGEVLISYAFAETPSPSDPGSIRLARCRGVECQVQVVATPEAAAYAQSGTDVSADDCGEALVTYSSIRWAAPFEPSVPLSLVSAGAGSSWSEELVAEKGASSQDIEVGALGPYLAFSTFPADAEMGRSAVALGHRAHGRWSVDLMTDYSIDWDYGDVALALDSEGRASVAYWGGDGLFVVGPGTAEWGPTRISDAPYGSRISLAADSAGSLHLSWAADDTVHYASNRSGAWETDDVAPSALFTSIAVDAADTVHLAFFPEGYATYQPVNGVDENCDGVDGIDGDGDGRASRVTGGDDDDDNDPAH